MEYGTLDHRSYDMLTYLPRDFIVYGLVDPETHQVRYVGSSTRGLLRPLSYKDYGHNLELAAWLRDLKNRNISYVVLILGIAENEDYVRMLESHWISEGLNHGWPLTNIQKPVDKLASPPKPLGKRWTVKDWRRDPEVRERLRQASVSRAKNKT